MSETKPEVEVTPEMIEAGYDAYGKFKLYRGDYPINDEILAAIFRAMLAAQ
jgi:hypothetical protein